MPGYYYLLDVSSVPRGRRKVLERRLRREIAKHIGLKRRTGNLRESAFAKYSERDSTIRCGTTADYSSFLELGVDHPWRLANGGIHPGLKRYRFIRKAIRRITSVPILREDDL